MQVKQPFFRYLDTNGDGTGDENAIGDYGTTPDVFFIQPAEGQIMLLSRIIVFVEDAKGFLADIYGGSLAPALTNGITMKVVDDKGTQIDLTNGQPIKTNSQWSQICYDAQLIDWGAGSNDAMAVRFTFAKSGSVIRLEGDKNERFEIGLSDSMVHLEKHTFMVQGYYETKEM